MIKIKDILHSITPVLSKEFGVDVFDTPKGGAFKNRCFYVSIIPIANQVATRYTNSKRLMVSIKYFGGDKIENYDIADKLDCLFTRSIKVKDRFINISNVEANFLNDEVGDMLDFLIYLDYNDNICVTLEEYDLMQDVNIEIKE